MSMADSEHSARVLVVENDPAVGKFLQAALGFWRSTLSVELCTDLGMLPNVYGRGRYSLAIVDARGRSGEVSDFLTDRRKKGDPTPVIVISGRRRLVSRTLKLSQVHHLRKPFGLQDLVRVLEGAMPAPGEAPCSDPKETHAVPPVMPASEPPFPAIGRSKTVLDLLGKLKKAARSGITLLFRGGTGTGKEFFAHLVHENSGRSKGPFVSVDCGMLPLPLVESELFGHAKGAFTGADSDRKGLVEMAEGGTLFLDEIGNAPPEVQPKLLKLLQDKTFRRLGSPDTRKVEARIIAATNADLEDLMRERRFREDLYFRLNVMTIHIPPLKERIEDLPILLDLFLDECSRKEGRTPPRVSRAAKDALVRHSWPGNVRELRNLAENLVADHVLQVIDLGDLPPSVLGAPSSPGGVPSRKRGVRSWTREEVDRLLRESGWVVTKAARRGGMSRKRLYDLMWKHQIVRSVKTLVSR